MKVIFLKAALFIICAFVFFSAANPAFAQGRRGRGGKKVIRLDAIKVEGRIQKPEAFLVFNRANLNHKALEEPETFTEKIFESLKEDEF